MRMLVLLYPLRVVGAILAWMMAHVSSSRRSSPNSPGGAAFGWGGPSSALPTSIPKPNELFGSVVVGGAQPIPQLGRIFES
jgi:hypothetical protein